MSGWFVGSSLTALGCATRAVDEDEVEAGASAWVVCVELRSHSVLMAASVRGQETACSMRPWYVSWFSGNHWYADSGSLTRSLDRVSEV